MKGKKHKQSYLANKQKKKIQSRSHLGYCGFTKEEQRNVKRYKETEKQEKSTVSRKNALLFEYKREILRLSKHLSQEITKSLLKESQKHPAEIVDYMEETNELFKKQTKKNNLVLVGIKNVDEIINEIVKSPRDFLLLLAYCSKPLKCPFRRFSEKCKPINRPVCDKCPFKKIVLKTKKIGCRCFIVTSDNLMFDRHLIPRFQDFINSKKYKLLLTVGCAWATNKFLRAAVIFGSIVAAYKFINGSCKNFKDYKEAEIGRKNRITKLNQKNWKEINYILDKAFMKIQYLKNHKYD